MKEKDKLLNKRSDRDRAEEGSIRSASGCRMGEGALKAAGSERPRRCKRQMQVSGNVTQPPSLNILLTVSYGTFVKLHITHSWSQTDTF